VTVDDQVLTAGPHQLYNFRELVDGPRSDDIRGHSSLPMKKPISKLIHLSFMCKNITMNI